LPNLLMGARKIKKCKGNFLSGGVYPATRAAGFVRMARSQNLFHQPLWGSYIYIFQKTILCVRICAYTK
jgi:hypothetical protein